MFDHGIRAILFDLNGVLVDVDKYKTKEFCPNYHELWYIGEFIYLFKLKAGIVTNCSRETANAAIASLPMYPRSWDVVVTRDDVGGKTKPHPYPWLLASYKLGIPISQCLAIDNKDTGIIAAVDAGAKTARINSLAELTEEFIMETLDKLRIRI